MSIGGTQLLADKILQNSVKPQTKRGDVYQLNSHRIMCGDSTKYDDIAKLLHGHKIKMIITDPPYGMNLDTDFTPMDRGYITSHKYNKVINDDVTYDPTPIFRYFRHVKEIFLWGADYYAESIPNRNDGSWIVWDKTIPGGNFEKMFGNNFELCWSKVKHKREIVRVLWKGMFGVSAQDVNKRLHPTQKPIELIRWFIERWSKEHDIICDLLLGSGTTLIAAEQTKRICYGMEISPDYIDVIIQRFENYTGKKAKLLPH